MNEPSQQFIATSMTLLVVSILATTLVVMVPTWKRFAIYYKTTSDESWRTITNLSILFVFFPGMVLLATFVSLWVSNDQWYDVFREIYFLMFVMVVLAFLLPSVMYLVFRAILQRLRTAHAIFVRRQRTRGSSSGFHFLSVMLNYSCTLLRLLWRGFQQKPSKRKRSANLRIAGAAGTVSALVCFVFTILISLSIVIGAIPIAIDVAIEGRPHQEDSEFARAMIMALPYTLASGLGCLGFSYVVELRKGEQAADHPA